MNLKKRTKNAVAQGRGDKCLDSANRRIYAIWWIKIFWDKVDSSFCESKKKQKLLKDSCEAPLISHASWCKKSDSRLQKCNRRFFARSGESEALSLKAKKRSFLGTHFKEVRESGERGAALFAKESSKLSGKNGEDFAESSPNSVDSANLLAMTKNNKFAESALDSAKLGDLRG